MPALGIVEVTEGWGAPGTYIVKFSGLITKEQREFLKGIDGIRSVESRFGDEAVITLEDDWKHGRNPYAVQGILVGLIETAEREEEHRRTQPKNYVIESEYPSDEGKATMLVRIESKAIAGNVVALHNDSRIEAATWQPEAKHVSVIAIAGVSKNELASIVSQYLDAPPMRSGPRRV
jgi:hypothetical protein